MTDSIFINIIDGIDFFDLDEFLTDCFKYYPNMKSLNITSLRNFVSYFKKLESKSINLIKNTGLKKITIDICSMCPDLNEILRAIIIKSFDTLEHIDIKNSKNTL